MQKAPSWFNTKQDIENSMQEYPNETASVIVELLQNRFFWTKKDDGSGEYVLREDPTSRIFLLGFSAQEAESLLPAGTIIVPPPPPVSYYAWEPSIGEWRVNRDALDAYLSQQLQQAKDAKLRENITARDARLAKGAEYEGIFFDADADSKVNIMLRVSIMTDTDTQVWYGVHNEPLLCNKQDLVNIGESIGTLTAFIWAYKNPEIVEAIREAKTIEELDEVVIDYSGA